MSTKARGLSMPTVIEEKAKVKEKEKTRKLKATPGRLAMPSPEQESAHDATNAHIPTTHQTPPKVEEKVENQNPKREKEKGAAHR